MADDDFDLPRWSNSTHSSHLPAQPSHPNGGQYSLFGQAAPPPQQPPSHHDHSRLSSIGQQQPTSSRHPTRLPHLLDSEAHSSTQDQGSSMMHVARSTSINTGARGRRQPDDLERAYSSDAPTSAASGGGGRQQINPFYPSSVAYQQAASPAIASHPSPSADGYMYYGSSTNPRRTQAHDRVSPPASAQSPQVMSSLDTYVQPQQPSTMYSTANYSDYVTPTQQSSTTTAFPSQVKQEASEPDMRSPPYVPQHPQAPAMSTQPSANLSYSTNPSYPSMDTQVSQSQLSVSSPSRPASHSSPNTPFSHSHGQIQQQYYGAPTSDQMTVESLPRRRSVGFKRVRDAKELRPYLNPTASGRRMDHEGIYLSVRFSFMACLHGIFLTGGVHSLCEP
jgi:dual specificity protein kinase YAK1